MEQEAISRATFAIIDVETTGFSPKTGAVVEVACLLVRDGRVICRFESLIDPRMPIPRRASAIHGITDADVAGKPTLRKLEPFLRYLCDEAIIVAHNARFDLSFLPFLAQRPVACSCRLAVRVAPEAPNHKNQTLRAFFNVADPALDGARAHRAMADAIVTRHVFHACLARFLGRGNDDSVEALLRAAA